MKITRLIIDEGDKSAVILDDSMHLDGVKSFTIHKEHGQPTILILNVDMIDVEIEQIV